MKIGFFDSGLGGLTILKTVAKELPDYDYEFYGDTANLPYGNKTEEEIFELTKRGMEHLFERGCILVIVACNTASAETLRKLQDGFLQIEHPDKKILGVIIPTVEEVKEANLKKVLMIATKRTVESGKYDIELGKLAKNTELVSVATPALVPLIELGNVEDALGEALSVIRRAGEDVDGLILGCTHYTLLREKIAKSDLGQKIKIFSQDEIIPKKIRLYLNNHLDIKNLLSTGGSRNIFLTNNDSRYDLVIQELLGGSFIGE
jgi:glutamate racemase